MNATDLTNLPKTHSNSSDALDKIRFEGLTDKSKLEGQVRPAHHTRFANRHPSLRHLSKTHHDEKDVTCEKPLGRLLRENANAATF